MTLGNYVCDGQMSIFDFLMPQKPFNVGDWVEEHGQRIMFEDVRVDGYYIADYSTESHKWYKVVYVKWIKDDSIGYVDSEKGIKGKWTWGNNYSSLTRKERIDADRDMNPLAKLSDTNGWWYEVSE